MDQQKNWETIESKLSSQLPYTRNRVLLLDGDRTLCKEDTSRLFLKMADLDFQVVKQGFKKYGYVYKAFYSAVKYYSSIPFHQYENISIQVAEQISLYPGICDMLHSIKDTVSVFIVSSGVRSIWQQIIDQNNIKYVHLLCGSRIDKDEYLIGKGEKGKICQFFKEKNRIVCAIGDTDVDSIMLSNADCSIVVVNHRRNKDLIRNLRDHPCIYQISFSDFVHNEIKQISYSEVPQIIYTIQERNGENHGCL